MKKCICAQLKQYKKDAFLCIGMTALEVVMEILLPFVTARHHRPRAWKQATCQRCTATGPSWW